MKTAFIASVFCSFCLILSLLSSSAGAKDFVNSGLSLPILKAVSGQKETLFRSTGESLPILRLAQEHRNIVYASCGLSLPTLRFAQGQRKDATASCERSNFETPISMLVSIEKANIFPIFSEVNSSDKIEEFYAKQSFWDCAPFYWECGMPFNNNAENKKMMDGIHDCKKSFLAKYPKLENKVVVLHLIRPIDKQICPTLSSDDIHAIENLVAIPIEKLKDPMLDQFRRERAIFYKDHKTPTEQELKIEAKSLKVRYKKLFVKANS